VVELLALAIFLAVGAGIGATVGASRARREAMDALGSQPEAAGRPWPGPVRAVAAELEGHRAQAPVVQSRLARVLSALPHGVLVFDGGGDLVAANAAGRAYVRARHGGVLVEAAVRALLTGLADGEQRRRQVQLAGPPRQAFEIIARRLEDGTATVVAVEDVSERRRLEEVRTDFVTNISHELRTPIGAISLLTETLADEDDPEVVARLARRVHDEAMRVSDTIDDLLVLSRIEAAGPPVDVVRLGGVFREAAGRVAAAAEERGIRVVPPAAAVDVAVRGDRLQLVSAVYNLLDNAVKYSDPGTTVELDAAADADGVTIEVRDRGIGIPARDLDRVFERFYRVDRARRRGTGGTGLGLSIVRHVVANHGGEVSVSSREGEGSTFRVRLPRADRPEGADRGEGPAGAAAGKGPAGRAGRDEATRIETRTGG
jgi:two-component system, OmpR family, sensor histidine kinase SenX3